VPLGSGTEHAEEALQRLAGNYPVIRVDRDTVKTTAALHEKLAAVRTGEPCILLGTQMLAKGHDFHDLTLAVLLDADGAFFSSELRAAEKAMQLLTQVAGRAGRGVHAGRVIVQTRLPSHPLVHQLLEQDYAAFAQAELAVREQLLMPPYAAMAVIRADAVSEDALASGLEGLKAALEDDIGSAGLDGCVAVHGPFPAVLARRKHRYHGLLWLLAARRGNLRTLMNNLMKSLNSPDNRKAQGGQGRSGALALPGRHGRSQTFSWIIDIDPYDTL
jgi:primosomal protein N' (replication factor Y)